LLVVQSDAIAAVSDDIVALSLRLTGNIDNAKCQSRSPVTPDSQSYDSQFDAQTFKVDK